MMVGTSPYPEWRLAARPLSLRASTMNRTNRAFYSSVAAPDVRMVSCGINSGIPRIEWQCRQTTSLAM